MKGLGDTDKKHATTFYDDYYQGCERLRADLAKFDNFTGEISDAKAQWENYALKQYEDSVTLNSQQAALNKVQTNLNKQVAGSAWQRVSQTLFDFYTNYSGVISKFSTLSTTNLTARSAFLTTSISTIQDALAEISTGASLKSSGVTNAAVVEGIAVLGSTSNLLSSVADLQKALKKPPVASLKIQLALLSAELDTTKQMEQLEEAKTGYAFAKFMDCVDEASRLHICVATLDHGTDMDTNHLLNTLWLRIRLEMFLKAVRILRD